MTGRNLFAKGKALIGIVISAIQILLAPFEGIPFFVPRDKGKEGILESDR